MKYDNVLIFGASGAVGSAAALEAHDRGAKVWLAMRDTNRRVAGLTPEQEKNGRYTRVQADLSDPSSVEKAVKQSGATAVFTYCLRDIGAMKASVQALKAAGVEYVVDLSSFTVMGDIRAISPKEFIPYFHAQAEIALQEAGIDLFSVRPGYFASNARANDLDRTTTPVQVKIFKAQQNGFYPIDPEDIGRVCGSALVDRPSESHADSVYLHGPEVMTNDVIWDIIKEVTGEPIEVHHLNREQYIAVMMGKGLPAVVAEYFADKLDAGGIVHKESDIDNVKKYTGRDATRFADYVAKHKEDFRPLNDASA